MREVNKYHARTQSDLLEPEGLRLICPRPLVTRYRRSPFATLSARSHIRPVIKMTGVNDWTEIINTGSLMPTSSITAQQEIVDIARARSGVRRRHLTARTMV